MNCPACKRPDEFVFEENTRVWRCDRCHERFLMKPRGTNEDAKEQLVRVVATNADRIRSMSDEEFAAIICAEFTAEKIPFCQNKEECMKILESDTIPEEMCRACALDWLRQPAKEEV